MEIRNQLLKRSVRHILLIFAGILAIIVLLNILQNDFSRSRQKKASLRVLNEVAQSLRSNEESAEDLSRIYHESNLAALEDLRYLFSSGLFDSALQSGREERNSIFQEICSIANAEALYLISSTGRVVMTSDADRVGINLVNSRLLTEDALTELTSVKEGGSAASPVSVSLDNGNYYFYSAPLSNGPFQYHLIFSKDSRELDEQLTVMNDVSDTIRDVTVSGSGFLFAVDLNSRTFLSFSDGKNNFTGEAVSDHIPNESFYRTGFSGNVSIDGKKYYCVSRVYRGNMLLVSAVPSEDVFRGNARITFWSAFLFCMVCAITLLYTVFVRVSLLQPGQNPEMRVLHRGRHGNLLLNASISRRVLPVALTGVLLLFGACYYVQMLLSLSNAVNESADALRSVEVRINNRKLFQDTVRQYYEQQYLAKARILAYILEEDPAALNEGDIRYYTTYNDQGLLEGVYDSEGNYLKSVNSSEILQSLCAGNDLTELFVFDEQGRTIASSNSSWYFTLSHDPDAQSYPFRQILERKKDFIIQEQQLNEEGIEQQYIGTVFYYYTMTDPDLGTVYVSAADYVDSQEPDWTGNPVTAHTSLLQVGMKSEIMDRAMESAKDDYVFRNMTVDRNGYLTAFDNTASHTMLYSPDASSIGKTAAELGISDKAFSGNYNGFSAIGGVDFFTCFRFYGGYYIASNIPLRDLYENCLPTSLVTALICFLFLSVMSLLIIVTTEEQEAMLRKLAEADSSGASDAGLTERQRHFHDMLNHSIGNPPWRDRTPEQKLAALLGFCVLLFSFYILFDLIAQSTGLSSNSIVSYILSDEWDKAFNIFALSKCLIIVIFISILIRLLRRFIRGASAMMGAKFETLGLLLISLIRYGGAIVSLFYCCYLVGFNSSALLTSAGIFSLIIGLGAQSLISDILAGIFIVFEGEYRVGDIITINDFRGEVLDIGLRTTKVMDSTRNIKIFNNSAISGVLNMAQETSYAVSDISFDYSESIERVEAVLKRELPRLRGKLPGMIGIPEYAGIVELAASAVNIRVIARCQEQDRIDLSRAMNRELLILFRENGISIPFPQVTVSKRTDEESGAK